MTMHESILVLVNLIPCCISVDPLVGVLFSLFTHQSYILTDLSINNHFFSKHMFAVIFVLWAT